MAPRDDDARLMLRYRDGDRTAFGALYARHKGREADQELRRFHKVYPDYVTASNQ